MTIKYLPKILNGIKIPTHSYQMKKTYPIIRFLTINIKDQTTINKDYFSQNRKENPDQNQSTH